MEDTYTSEEAITQFVNHGLSASRLYRRVTQGEIKKYLPTDRVRGALYSKADVDRVCKAEGKHPTVGAPVAIAKEKKELLPSDKVVIRQLTKNDIGAAYFLQFKQVGIENTVQPTSMHLWIESGEQYFWVACNPEDTNDVWAVIGAIPVGEELLLRFLRGEFTLQEIAISDVFPYDRGEDRTCYLVAGADQRHTDALIQLMEHLLSYWCEKYPDICVSMLYVSSPLPTQEETALLTLLKTFFFSRRRDLSLVRGVWELALDEYNPSPSVKQFQKCVQEKRMLVAEDVRTGKHEINPPFLSSLHYRRAETKEDVAAMVRIGAEIFVPPGVTPSISNEYQVDVWYSWLQRNPEIFNIVTHDDDIVGYISLIPLPIEVIDKVMRGAHPTTIKPDDVLPFEPGKSYDLYAHMWGTTTKLSELQKRTVGSTILRELRRTFASFARRSIDIRSIWTRSNTKDGIRISKHLGFEDLVIPGVTDDPDPEHRKHVFRVNTLSSTHPFMVLYRQMLEQHRHAYVVNGDVSSAS